LVLADFHVPWCRVLARMLFHPMVIQLAGKFTGKVRFARLNMNGAPGVASLFDAIGVPVLIVLCDGSALIGRSACDRRLLGNAGWSRSPRVRLVSPEP